MKVYERKHTCRACRSSNLKEIIYFGETPLADALIKKEKLEEEEIKVPLTFAFCEDCSLAQILEEVEPTILFCRDYPYYSSVSKALLEHFRQSALNLIELKKLNSNSLVIEAASNDGYMLKNFFEKNIPVIGIDPAEGQAKAANENGIYTINDFFTIDMARKLALEGKKADLFLANNVLAHVPDLNGFVEGIKTVLKDDGLAVIEAPYVVDLVDHVEFDTIYHQHLCYFSVTALDRLFRSHDLYLNDVERIPIHGGSLRLYVEKKEKAQSRVKQLLQMEQERKVNKIDFYVDFADRVKQLKTDLIILLDSLKKEGKKIVGYGAAAKANTFQSYMGIGKNYLNFIADLSKYKQGLYFSGNKLLIEPPSKIIEEMPDYVLILAWNFANEIINQQEEYKKRGGKFIIPIPRPVIV